MFIESCPLAVSTDTVVTESRWGVERWFHIVPVSSSVMYAAGKGHED